MKFIKRVFYCYLYQENVANGGDYVRIPTSRGKSWNFFRWYFRT